MNCDHVFAILTRGPFPSGSQHDDAVETHLQFCPECQRLAEALRPNSDSQPETIGLDDGQALPGYWGAAIPASGDLAVSLGDKSRQLQVEHCRRRSKGSPNQANLHLWQFTAAVALGIVLAAALRTLMSPRSLQARSGIETPLADGARSYSQRNAGEMLALLDLKPVCRESYANTALPLDTIDDAAALGDPTVTTPTGDKICCTQCHRAGGEIKLTAAQMVRFQHSCRACHD
ncbi:MAG TPA: hypothetical protein VGJ15_08110 [Pirellulales bacterium]